MHTFRTLLCAATLAVAAATPDSSAAVIYRETFGLTGVAVDQFPFTYDWERFDNFGQPITTTGSSSGVNYTVAGRPTDVSNVNAGPNNDGTFGPYPNGLLYFAATPASLGFTTEYTVDPALYVPDSIVFSWYEGNNTAAHTFRLLVRVGNAWYASAETFTTPAVTLANFGTQAQFKTKAYNPVATNWVQVTFDGDYIMGETPGTGTSVPSSLGEVLLTEAPAADLSGPITAFGLYGDNGGSATGNRRIDSFTIEATPLIISANKTVTWRGDLSADWDLLTANWRTNTANPATYSEGDIVRFDDSATTTDVTIVPLVLPASVTVSNETKTYKFLGGGVIGGSATLRKIGSGSLIVANANNSFTGGVSIEQGTLQIGEDGAVGSIGTGNITNNAVLTFQRTGTLTLSNSISGSGAIHFLGDGTNIFAGSNSYSGVTYLSKGTLILNGLNAGGTLITNNIGSALAGSGTNTGPVEIMGIMSPGDGIGTLTVGNLLLSLGATNIMDLATTNTIGAGVNDLLQVNGGLTLSNNKLIVRLTDLPQTSVPYRLINYTGTRIGNFDPEVQIVGISRYTAAISYDDTAKAVNLTFTPPANPSTVIYRETFGIPPGSTVDQPATAFEWIRFDNFGQPITSVAVNFSAEGRPVNVANVNAGPNSDLTFSAYTNGIFYLAATPSPSLGLTTEFTVNPTNYIPGSIVFSWYEGNNTAPHTFRLLVRVGGLWYASAEVFTTPAVALTSFGAQAQLKMIAYDPNPVNWLTVNFDGDFILGETPGAGTPIGSSLADVFLGEAPATPLNGSITAFGVYGDNGGSATGNRRIDTFTVEAAPVSTAAIPRIASATLQTDSIVLNLENGPAGWSVRVLASSDVALPRSQWANVKTAIFDQNGTATITIPIDPAAPQQFYAVQSP